MLKTVLSFSSKMESERNKVDMSLGNGVIDYRKPHKEKSITYI